MNNLIAKERVDLLALIASTTRNRIPIVVTRTDGSNVIGAIVTSMINSVVLERPDGTRIKVRFGSIDRISRPGGRSLWKRGE